MLFRVQNQFYCFVLQALLRISWHIIQSNFVFKRAIIQLLKLITESICSVQQEISTAKKNWT